MTARSSTFAWETPWAEEPGGLQSTGPHRVRATKHTRVGERKVLGLASRWEGCLEASLISKEQTAC